MQNQISSKCINYFLLIWACDNKFDIAKRTMLMTFEFNITTVLYDYLFSVLVFQNMWRASNGING